MSDTANSFSLSPRRWLLGGLVSAVLAVCYGGGAAAEEVKQIKLTEKQVQGYIATAEPLADIFEDANPDKPDPKLDAQALALVKKNGFASLDEYDDVAANIAMIMSGLNPQTKEFTEPADQIKAEINTLKADKKVSAAVKREELAELDAALKDAKPVQFKENIDLVLKYFDKLLPLVESDD